MLKLVRVIALQALLMLCCAFCVQSALAEELDVNKLVTPTLVADTTAVVPGKAFKVGVILKMLPHWHTYYKVSGEAGMPTKIQWSLPPGYTATDLLWKKPTKFTDAGITTYGYQDETVVGATITPPPTATIGAPVSIKATVKWLACQDQCVPGKRDLTMNLTVGRSAQSANAQTFEGLGWTGDVKTLNSATSPATGSAAAGTTGAAGAAEAATTPGKFSGSILDADLKVASTDTQKLSLPVALLFAFIGGFILNFMPCVLPVISIKVMSFMQQAGDDPKRVFRLGLTFTAGIVSTFLVLAGIIIALQQAGQQVGWGFQFQAPIFVFAMATIVLMFALSLFGLFYVQVNAGQDQIDKMASKEGYTGTFFKGVLATTLSTPCSAPFLGSGVGFAFSQPPYVVLLTFIAVAIGMAFPYVLLTAQPAWMKYLPRPGVWMEKFKESMGFLLLATVVWLVWTLGQQVGNNASMAAVGFLVALSFAVWLVGRFTDLTSTGQRKAVVYAIAGLVVVGAYWSMLRPNPAVLAFSTPQPDPIATPTTGGANPYKNATAVSTDEIDWQPFSIDRLNEELKAGKTVFVDFTADWCLTCKVNESTVLNTKPVIAKLREVHAVTLRADWTRQDPQIAGLLHKFGRSGVPLYVVFPGSRPTQPIVLPEAITTDLVVAKLAEAN